MTGRGQMVGIKAVWSVCWDCDECKDGDDALCANGVSTGAHKSGTFQEYSIGPASYVTPIPDGIDPLIAAPVMVSPCLLPLLLISSAVASPHTKPSKTPT